VYTGLSFFRQLPAGVPGAYRLFMNLLGLNGRRSLKWMLLVLSLTACSWDPVLISRLQSPRRDLLTLFEHRFEALHPDVDVPGSTWVAGRLRSRALRAGESSGRRWFGGPSLILAQAAGDSLLDCYRPSWAGAIAARGRGPGDCYFAAYETPAVFSMRRSVKPEEPAGLGRPPESKMEGKLIIRDPLASARCGRCSD